MIRVEANRPGGPRGRGGKAPVDDEAEQLLKTRLSALLPCGWHGEETGAEPIGAGDIWIVDPHDGTSDFLKGLRGSAISVALLRGGRPVLGVVYAPLAPDDGGDLFAWAEGAALARNGQSVELKPGGLRVLALNADAADYAAHNQAALPGWRIRAVPSPAYRLALAAAGEVDAAVSLVPGLCAWDIAGGHALLLGAGGVLTDRRGRSIDYRRAPFDGMIGGRKEAVAALAGRLPGRGREVPRYPARPKTRVSDAARLSRAQGCLLGQLAGDALGSAVRSKSRRPAIRVRPPTGPTTRSTSPKRCWRPARDPRGRRRAGLSPTIPAWRRAMSDFQTLTPQFQALLQIKLDGYIEACLLAARQQNIGLEEALQLTC